MPPGNRYFGSLDMNSFRISAPLLNFAMLLKEDMFALPGYRGGAKKDEPPSSPRTYEEIRAYIRRHTPKAETPDVKRKKRNGK